MNEVLDFAVNNVRNAQTAFCRFITANDTGDTGSHQEGFYIPKCASSLLFDTPGVKGENKDKYIKMKWQNDFTTDSRFIYYGKGTRNEYRVTRFGKNFPFLQEGNVGSLLVIAKNSEEDYSAFVLSADQDIDDFFAFFNLSSENTNQLIDIASVQMPDEKLHSLFMKLIVQYTDFPDTTNMGKFARDCYNQAYLITDKKICADPDKLLLKWVDAEYSLFRSFEEKIYSNIYKKSFSDCQALINFANSILNRRKSRAGKSLEYHLATIFSTARLKFEEQVITEDNKKPDFIFPDGKSYHNFSFPADHLVFLGAKTTCKDRWRQVLNEANRIETKYLFTLQQGISKNQLQEMQHEKLVLVVPAEYKNSFNKMYHSNIETLSSFIEIVKAKQTSHSIFY